MTLQVAGSPNMSEAFEISSCGMLCKQHDAARNPWRVLCKTGLHASAVFC